jgi:hypothetical protein
MTNLAEQYPDIVETMYRQLNLSVLTSYLHGASGPEGNPGGVERCSPPALLGPCNETCAAAYYGESSAQRASPIDASKCTMHVYQKMCYHSGKPLKKIDTKDPTECCVQCQSNSDCTHWTLNVDDSPYCHLKSGVVGKITYDDACTSGSNEVPPTPPCPSGSDFPLCGVPGCL